MTDSHQDISDGEKPVRYGDEKIEDAAIAEVASNEEVPKMTWHRFGSFVSMAFLFTGAQIPPYLYGGIPPIIYGDLGGADRWTWFITANLLALAAVCPFTGALSDLIGRRYVALLGFALVIAGQIVCGLVKSMNNFIAGMALAGAGAGIMELTALAGTAELAPTAKRGLYVAILIFTIVPFVPSVMWGQLIAAHTNWRYVALLIGIYNFIGFVTTLCFYFPPPRINSAGLTRREVLRRIDYVGGLLSIIGVILLVAAIFWGGYMYSWRSAHVLVPLFLGAAFLVAFVFWEAYAAKYPMFPYKHLGRAPRTLVMTLVITFISGANFFSVLMLWPTQAYNVYGHDPVGVGLRGLPFGMGVMVGCIITLLLLTKFRGGIRWLLFGASCVMTAGCGALAAANLHNMGGIYVVLLISGLGVGGIVVPASIITTIICPDDVIATITSLTLAIRVIGGAVGYSIYYNVLLQKLTPKLTDYIGVVMLKGGISNIQVIKSAIELTGASLLDEIRTLPGVTDALWKQIVAAGQLAYSESYPWVYYCSIAFGGVSIIASLFLEDIDKFMDDHIAVVIH